MSVSRRRLRALLLVAAGAAVGCGAFTAGMKVQNPARTAEKIEAKQTFSIPPDKDNHRYEATLANWTATAVSFSVRVVNMGECGQMASFTLTLADDQGREYPWRQTAAPVEKIIDANRRDEVHDTTATGEFAAPIGPQTKFVVLHIRPVPGKSCRGMDFRWDFEG